MFVSFKCLTKGLFNKLIASLLGKPLVTHVFPFKLHAFDRASRSVFWRPFPSIGSNTHDSTWLLVYSLVMTILPIQILDVESLFPVILSFVRTPSGIHLQVFLCSAGRLLLTLILSHTLKPFFFHERLSRSYLT